MKTIINLPSDLISKQYNPTIVATLATIIVVGIMLIFSHNIINFEDNTPISMLVTCGVFAAIVTSAVLSFSLKQTVLADGGSPLICNVIEFHESNYSMIANLASEGKWKEIDSIANSGSGIAMKVEFVYSQNKRFAAYQMFKYVPHSYEPCSEIFYINKEIDWK